MLDKPIFEISSPGRLGAMTCRRTVEEDPSLEDLIDLRRDHLDLPEISENQAFRHFVALSNKNYHIDKGMYPLGSCTMKYNPKVNEDMASLDGFASLHPSTPVPFAHGALELMFQLKEILQDLTGMEDGSLQPAAGAQGELTSLMMVKRYFASQGEVRDVVLTPDSAHGTNPASASMCRMGVKEIRSNANGQIDIEHLQTLLDDRTACVMITNPNTLGIFEEHIDAICDRVHEAGALVYMDGANMNALLGYARPGDMGFDVMHLNLHKTFSTPHGGGGPGAGPIFCKSLLSPYLPVPRVVRCATGYALDADAPDTVGRVHGHFGNFGMLCRAYTYILSLGLEGLTRVAYAAVLNANYLKKSLEGTILLDPFPGKCMHEFVLSGAGLKAKGVRTLDLAKRLLDKGFHAPTIYFPLIVEEALMIEPTESESLETLDTFVRTVQEILGEIDSNPGLVTSAPHDTPVRRLDETRAARNPVLAYNCCLPGGEGA